MDGNLLVGSGDSLWPPSFALIRLRAHARRRDTLPKENPLVSRSS